MPIRSYFKGASCRATDLGRKAPIRELLLEKLLNGELSESKGLIKQCCEFISIFSGTAEQRVSVKLVEKHRVRRLRIPLVGFERRSLSGEIFDLAQKQHQKRAANRYSAGL